MKNSTLLMLLAVATCLPLGAHAQDAQTVLATMHDRQLARWDGVNLYVVEQTLMGQPSRTYFQRIEVEDDQGDTHTLFLPVSRAALSSSGSCDDVRRMSPEQLRAFASGAEMTGDAVAGGIEQGMSEAGLPPGLLSATGSSPSSTLNPRVLMGGSATFLRAAASAREQAGSDSADSAKAAAQVAAVMDQATLQGTEQVDGREAYLLRATGLGQTQPFEGGEYTLDTVSVWIDTEHYVPLQTRMEGMVTSNGETRPITIERLDRDYRRVPDSNLYEPYRQVTSMSGMMDAEQQAQMREAEAQMAEMEQQLKNMPANQRAMMERMMGPQLEMIRNMAQGGGFQMEITVNSITVNPAGDGQPCAPAR